MLMYQSIATTSPRLGIVGILIFPYAKPRSNPCTAGFFGQIPAKSPRYLLKFNFLSHFITQVGISRTTAKLRERIFATLSHLGHFAVVASSRKSQTKVGTLACFDFL